MPEAPAIEIQAVTKRFREKVAVDRLDLVVPTGSVCGFLGPNGAGKTTTIRMVMSIFYPDEGSIAVLGRRSATESKDRIGYLPEERGVYRKMKVGEFLTYIGAVKGVPKSDLSSRIDTWLERVQLPGVRKKKCAELSKGMQQKVQFLATIIHDPDLIILDEPFSGLDPVNSRLVRTLIEEMRREGKTIIFSTHVLHSAEQLCDRIFMINNGKKILDGPVGDIRSQFDPKTISIKTMAGQSDPTKIERVDGVASVTHPAADVIEAHLSQSAQPTRVMADILQATPVRGVELRQATLEDIFVQLVDPGDSEDSVRSALTEVGAGIGAGASNADS